MKLTEAQKQRICDYIQGSLNGAKLKHLYVGDGTGDNLRLVDLLSLGSTIKDGQEEIKNLAEAIYFDMGEWDI